MTSGVKAGVIGVATVVVEEKGVLFGISPLPADEAACTGDGSTFFDVRREAEAKRVCRSCEIRWDCLGYALATRQRYGVWGGLTPEERRLLMRKVRGSDGDSVIAQPTDRAPAPANSSEPPGRMSP